MSERITENIVREHFRNDPLFSTIKLEEQRSSKNYIKELFQYASKSNTNQIGFPEFIITIPQYPDMVIIVECKSGIAKHMSLNRQKPKEFAVDGIYHYMQKMNQVDSSYTILGIAVSGFNKEELLVTHFISRKDDINIQELENKELLSLYSYIKTYKSEEVATALGNISLVENAIKYNEELQSFSIPETERCTFMSAILLALQNDHFRETFSIIDNPPELLIEILNACDKVLKKNKITDDRKEIMLNHYKSIQNQGFILKKEITNKKTKKKESNDLLLRFTKKLNKDVYPLLQYNQEEFDVLGRFYTEFIRYAGSDKKTGLVLTPSHISELFCELVDLNVGDVVYDCCCGTGGFLISAMKYLLKKAGSNQDIIAKIKSESLLGVELRGDMFTYACSNMMMRGDGKSHIYYGDSFDNNIIKTIKDRKPNIAFLNPPYDVGADGQLDFISNAMNTLTGKNPRCAAIVQMSCALTSSKEVIKQHEILLKNHTLEAVISMPDDLFYPVGVVTCIMVFTPHKPHAQNHPTWFGYLKDDGFIKKKHQGRVNIKWGKIKDELLKYYKYSSKESLSICQVVKPEDEWCAEAYMETDYTQLTQAHFEETLRKYASFLVGCKNES